MSSTPSQTPSPHGGYVIPPRYWAWLGSRRVVAALLWFAVVGCAIALTYRTFHWFDNATSVPRDRQRDDGNGGHAQIDFGGQWLMGRMVATGHGRELYYRQRQRLVLREGYPIADEAPIQREEAALPLYARRRSLPGEEWQHDADNLMNWFMGEDPKEWKKVGGAVVAPLAQPPTGNPFVAVALEQHAADTLTPEVVAKVNEPAVGGPLYPPVHALFYAPLGMIDSPRIAYRAFQVFSVLLVFVAGLGVKVVSRGRIWWSVATLALLFYPGMRGGLDLGQNPVVSLCIVIWGWALASRGYNVAGGIVWGLFAFKPVWALAFLIVPLLSGRWRFFFAMAFTGAGFVLLTLPIVGIESWFHWLHIGQEASALYKVNDNWIHLSRDLQGIPRRILLDFTKPQAERGSPLADALAWGLWGFVFGATVLIYLFRADRKQTTGVGAGFLLLGAYLTCFHFMYYDVLISAAALAVLFSDPRFARPTTFALEPLTEAKPAQPLAARMLAYVNSFPLTLLVALYIVENSLMGLDLEATFGARYFASPATDGSTEPRMPRVRAGTGPRYPLDAFVLLAIWAWCGVRLLCPRPRASDHRTSE